MIHGFDGDERRGSRLKESNYEKYLMPCQSLALWKGKMTGGGIGVIMLQEMWEVLLRIELHVYTISYVAIEEKREEDDDDQ